MIPGIDVSVWQDDNSTARKMDFSKTVAKGAKFVFVKVSERGGMDQDYFYNWQSAKEAGLLRGGYHYLRWDLSGLLQARIFCDLLKDDPGELPPVADFEAPIRDGKYPSNALLEQFLVEVENRLGRRPMIYTSPGFWNSYGKIKNSSRFDPKWSYWPLWIAHYTKAEAPQVPQPWKKWLFWQHGVYPVGLEYGAESKGLDLNWFNGSLQDLYALANLAAPPTPPAPTPTPAPPLSGGAGGVDIAGLKLRIVQVIDTWAETIPTAPTAASQPSARAEGGDPQPSAASSRLKAGEQPSGHSQDTSPAPAGAIFEPGT